MIGKSRVSGVTRILDNWQTGLIGNRLLNQTTIGLNYSLLICICLVNTDGSSS